MLLFIHWHLYGTKSFSKCLLGWWTTGKQKIKDSIFLNPERQQKTPKTWCPNHQLRPYFHTSTSGTCTSSVLAASRTPHHHLPFSKTGMIKEINLSLWHLPPSPCQGWDTRSISSNPGTVVVDKSCYTTPRGVYSCWVYTKSSWWDSTITFTSPRKGFCLGWATHIGDNLDDRKAIFFMASLMWFLYSTIRDVQWNSSSDNCKGENAMSTCIAMKTYSTSRDFPSLISQAVQTYMEFTHTSEEPQDLPGVIIFTAVCCSRTEGAELCKLSGSVWMLSAWSATGTKAALEFSKQSMWSLP